MLPSLTFSPENQIKTNIMKISARNIFKGTVSLLDVGAVNTEVVVEIAPGIEVTSVVTKKSAEGLGLEVGGEATVIIKASSVLVGVE
jgi:molybdopterin-binding protein